MPDKSFMTDDDFDSLVDRLHSLTFESRSGTVDRWEIRVLLADHGVMPARVASVPSMEDSLVASLRAICRRAERSGLNAEAA